MKIEHFANMVETLSIEDLNGALENFNESENDIRRFPNATDRALARIHGGEFAVACC
jgi:hypothetical protein